MMKEVVSTGSATSRCPKCDYDLRGLTGQRCPECGQAFSSREVAEYADRRWPPQRLFRTLILATIPWFSAYWFFDALHDTADRAKLNWMTLPFLVIPIQLILATTAAASLEASSTRPMKRIGAVLTIIVWILILGHIVITAWTL